MPKPIRLKIRLSLWWQKPWVRRTAVAVSIPAAALAVAAVYYYISFARLIDARLHGERERVFPRVFARPLELHRGQALTARQLIDRLNDLGYTQRTTVDKPGEFAVTPGTVGVMPRSPEAKGQAVRVVFQRPPAAAPRPPARKAPPPRPPDHVLALDLGKKPAERV